MRKLIVLLLTATIGLVACSSEKEPESSGTKTESSALADSVVRTDSGTLKTTSTLTYIPSGIPYDLNGKPLLVGGLTFTPATQWTNYGPSGMRKGSYSFGPLQGDTDSATVAVFYFGEDEGGTIEANLERWINQMSLPDGRDPHTATIQYVLQVDGMRVHMLTLLGIYEVSIGGPMSRQKEEKENYRLVAAIFEAPRGNVFFKLTGPDYTARIMIEAFMAAIKTATKSG